MSVPRCPGGWVCGEERGLHSGDILAQLLMVPICFWQVSGERLPPEPLPAPLGPTCPIYQFQYSPPVPHPLFHGYEDWQQIRYPPPAEHGPIQNFRHFPPVSRTSVLGCPLPPATLASLVPHPPLA